MWCNGFAQSAFEVAAGANAKLMFEFLRLFGTGILGQPAQLLWFSRVRFVVLPVCDPHPKPVRSWLALGGGKGMLRMLVKY
jgi:hypothetical protein